MRCQTNVAAVKVHRMTEDGLHQERMIAQVGLRLAQAGVAQRRQEEHRRAEPQRRHSQVQDAGLPESPKEAATFPAHRVTTRDWAGEVKDS
jgi:hypothetical protein